MAVDRAEPQTQTQTRLRLVVLFALQIGSSGAAFVTWSILSHRTTEADFAVASTSLAWGMSAYLPMTLGLPFLLGNFYRNREDPDSHRSIRTTINVSTFVGIVAQIVGVGAAAVRTTALGNDIHPALPGAACVAGLACTSVTLQQLARIRMRIHWMALALVVGVSVPATYLAEIGLGLDGEQGSLVICAILACASLGQVAVFRRGVASVPQTSSWPAARRLLAISLPLVPHLVAFGLLQQGTRLASTLGSSSAKDVSQSNFLMLFLGIGFAVISGAHGMLSASIQQTQLDQLVAKVAYFSRAYGVTGALASTGVAIAAVSPLRKAMSGMEALSGTDLAILTSIPGSLCSYYFMSTLLLAHSSTRVLALVTVTSATAYFTLSAAMPWTSQELLRNFAITMSGLHVVALPVVVRRTGIQWPAIFRSLVNGWIGFIPAAVIGVAIPLSSR